LSTIVYVTMKLNSMGIDNGESFLPLLGLLGDQQAALVGQMCLSKGMAKNTYGTGCFLLYNTGNQVALACHIYN